MNTISDTVRFCADLGMFTIDRSISKSCTHKTSFCESNCFNDKLYKLYPAMHDKDVRNELAWDNLDQRTSKQFSRSMARKRRQTSRIRLMSRGEAFSVVGDVAKVKVLLSENPDSLFWIPTRAWRNPVIWALVQSEIMPLSNGRVMASLDPSNTDVERRDLESAGFSTMYFGDDEKTAGRFKCPKTWQKSHGKDKKVYCDAKCRNGCFSDKQVHVHLKKH